MSDQATTQPSHQVFPNVGLPVVLPNTNTLLSTANDREGREPRGLKRFRSVASDEEVSLAKRARTAANSDASSSAVTAQDEDTEMELTDPTPSQPHAQERNLGTKSSAQVPSGPEETPSLPTPATSPPAPVTANTTASVAKASVGVDMSKSADKETAPNLRRKAKDVVMRDAPRSLNKPAPTVVHQRVVLKQFVAVIEPKASNVAQNFAAPGGTADYNLLINWIRAGATKPAGTQRLVIAKRPRPRHFCSSPLTYNDDDNNNKSDDNNNKPTPPSLPRPSPRKPHQTLQKVLMSNRFWRTPGVHALFKISPEDAARKAAESRLPMSLLLCDTTQRDEHIIRGTPGKCAAPTNLKGTPSRYNYNVLLPEPASQFSPPRWWGSNAEASLLHALGQGGPMFYPEQTRFVLFPTPWRDIRRQVVTTPTFFVWSDGEAMRAWKEHQVEARALHEERQRVARMPAHLQLKENAVLWKKTTGSLLIGRKM
ncbi:hypothetical protein BD413DRAFT_681145 [Trametes elegans]|nr:hypothetical protein BD413DRAFT_681145 [Trametes elegans]